MKSFQQNLLIALALALCALCVWQWHFQTVQRGWLDDRNHEIAARDTKIEGYTNSLDKMNGQITRMDQTVAGLNSNLEAALKTNSEFIIQLKRQAARVGASNDTLLSDIAQYTNAIATLQSNLDTAYAGIKKQNTVVEELVTNRDYFVQKYTNTVTLYNDLVGKYTNALDRINQLQAAAAAATNAPRK
jgi:chromosome segregation ATPase